MAREARCFGQSKGRPDGTPSGWETENERLRLRVDARTASFCVLDKEAGLTWQMTSPPTPVKVHAPGGSQEIALEEIDGKHMEGPTLVMEAAGLAVTFALTDRRVTIVLEPLAVERRPFTEEIVYPGPFVFTPADGAYAVLPIKQGLLVPDTGVEPFHHPRGYIDQSMSFFGVVRPRGSMLAVVETDADWRLVTFHEPGGTCTPCAWWRSRFGTLGYPREITLHFSRGGSHVTLAKAYRRWAESAGRAKTLAEKVAENPNVETLRGACRLTTMICTHDTRRFIHTVRPFDEAGDLVEAFQRETGQTRAEVHVDGWGFRGYDNLHPDVLPPCPDAGGLRGLAQFSRRVRALGYLFGLHDQYWDIYYDAPHFDASLLVLDETGRPLRNCQWAGGLQAKMCAVRAIDFLRRNYETGVTTYVRCPGLLETVEPTASYLDCFVMNYECHHPDHPLTRSQARDAIAAILRYARSKHVVLSVEHAADWAVPLLDMLFWLPHLKRSLPEPHAKSRYLGVPVPLWNLVYRDCLVVPGRIVADAEDAYRERFLRELLYGSMPVFALPMTDETRPRVTRELLLSRLHAEHGFDEMVDHRFVSPDFSLQRTEFAGGISVLVDFTRGTYTVEGSTTCSTAGPVSVIP